MLRSVLFWIHLAAGVVAGAIIAVMSFTGALLAFEHELVEWAERDARRVERPAAAVALPLDEQLASARRAHPGAEPSGITIAADPRAATAVSFGRGATYYVNPYTGEVRQPRSTATHDFLHLMVEWHRWLALGDEQRATGRAITGACNTAFLVLGLTGLYLWWPRSWNWRTLRPSLWFYRARGKARDWNWHNVIGLWTLPVLIVLTASGMVISYRWASNLVYRVAGEAPPAQQGPGAFAGAPIALPPPPPGAERVSPGVLFAAARQAVPNWESISLRAPRGRGGPTAAEGTQAVTLSVRELGRFPSFASTTVALDPYSGEVLERTGFSDLSSGRQARLWMRWLHVGQGFGWGGQLIALIACLGALVLVYTGFALAWRRLVRRRPPANGEAAAVRAGGRASSASVAGR